MRLKRGDTFKLEATILGDDAPIVGGIAAWGIRSQIRTLGGELIDTLVATITDPVAGNYTLNESAAGVTADWPVGDLYMDIEYVVAGDTVSTDTIKLEVVKDETI